MLNLPSCIGPASFLACDWSELGFASATGLLGGLSGRGQSSEAAFTVRSGPLSDALSKLEALSRDGEKWEASRVVRRRSFALLSEREPIVEGIFCIAWDRIRSFSRGSSWCRAVALYRSFDASLELPCSSGRAVR